MRAGTSRTHGRSPEVPQIGADGEHLDPFEHGLELIRSGEFFAAHEELETAWRDQGYSPTEFSDIENAYLEGLKLEDRYFESLYHRS